MCKVNLGPRCPDTDFGFDLPSTICALSLFLTLARLVDKFGKKFMSGITWMLECAVNANNYFDHGKYLV